MKLLLDTHIVIWWLAASPRLGKSAHTLIQENDCTVSVATFIESRFLALAEEVARKTSAFQHAFHANAGLMAEHG